MHLVSLDSVEAEVEHVQPRWKRALDVVWPRHPTTWRGLRERLVPEIINLLRLTLATVLGYAAGRWLLPGPIDLTGALTALLVVQASARGSFAAGLGRVGAVLGGVGIALLFSTWVGLSWWSLALVIASALLVAKLFRLGSASLETPISAMLILGSAGHGLAAETRVGLTLIGTAVGMILPLLWPPAVPTQPAAQAVREVGRRLASIFEQAAEYADRRPVTRAVAAEWFADTRRVNDALGTARRRIREISEFRAWNARAVGTADVGPILSSGLDALERCLLAARALFLVVSNEAPGDEAGEGGFSEEIRRAFAVVLADVGTCVDAYAALVEAEASGHEEEAQRTFASTIELLDETRAILTDLMLVDPGETGTWMMHASVLKAVDQILTEVNLETHVGRRQEWEWSQLGRKFAGGTIGPATRNPLRRWSNARLRARSSASDVPDDEIYADFADAGTTLSLPVVPAAPQPDDGRIAPPPSTR